MNFSVYKGSLKGKIFKSSPVLSQHFGFSSVLARACGSALRVLAFRLKGEANLYVSSSQISGGGHRFGNLEPELCHQLLPWVLHSEAEPVQKGGFY